MARRWRAEAGEVVERVSAKSAHRFREVTRKECYREIGYAAGSIGFFYARSLLSAYNDARESRLWYRLVESRLAT